MPDRPFVTWMSPDRAAMALQRTDESTKMNAEMERDYYWMTKTWHARQTFSQRGEMDNTTHQVLITVRKANFRSVL